MAEVAEASGEIGTVKKKKNYMAKKDKEDALEEQVATDVVKKKKKATADADQVHDENLEPDVPIDTNTPKKKTYKKKIADDSTEAQDKTAEPLEPEAPAAKKKKKKGLLAAPTEDDDGASSVAGSVASEKKGNKNKLFRESELSPDGVLIRESEMSVLEPEASPVDKKKKKKKNSSGPRCGATCQSSARGPPSRSGSGSSPEEEKEKRKAIRRARTTVRRASTG